MLMICQTCSSDAVFSINVHSRDNNSIMVDDLDHEGYLPYIDNICGGDDLSIDLCMECGQVQGKFSKKTAMKAYKALHEAMGIEDDTEENEEEKYFFVDD